MTDARTTLADIRRRNEERKAAEAKGVIGGVRTAFDVDFLLRYIDGQRQQVQDAATEIEELNEFQNSIASRIPERYEDDVAQEAIIDRWLDDITEPRTITTAEELDALRFQAVVLDSYGTPYVCERHRTDGTRNEWRQAGMNSLDESETILFHGEVTVVYEGEPQP